MVNRHKGGGSTSNCDASLDKVPKQHETKPKEAIFVFRIIIKRASGFDFKLQGPEASYNANSKETRTSVDEGLR